MSLFASHHHLKKLLSYVILTAFFISVSSLDLSAKSNKSKKAAKAASLLTAAKSDSKTESDSAIYARELKGFKCQKGMFRLHQDKTGKLYVEIPRSAFSHTYLLMNRVAETSNTHDFVAGQIATSPLLLRFSHDTINVYMHKVATDAAVDENDPIAPAFRKAFQDPVLKGFKIKARTDSSLVIDMTTFFGENEKCISPIRPDSPLGKLLGTNNQLKGTFNSSASSITECKAFPLNIMVKSRLSYTISMTEQPYTVEMSRCILQLPDTPMKTRLQDNRVGYFSQYKRLFSSNKDRVEEYNIIHRWRLEPKPEDMARYEEGQLVEPQKKIVFYIDSAFPQKWMSAVKEGVEYWNKAFEAAGFKNAIEARVYPKDNPDFDPDDARYSCIRYCVTTTANAMGPSYVDPRTGEIISADVIWYHNILSLVHNWKLVQTGAVDPRVRQAVFNDATMHEALTYVAAHEIGHTLGLMHNMGASFAFPTDKLRDPAFTQQYGTTPSIMDYARNNFIAQPGDYEKGVKLTPPNLGVYDIYAINWGYRLIPDAKTPIEEKPTLDAWIRSKQGDPMYEFGAQQFLGLVDPTDQTEDLSDDQIKAGTLSISNLKIVLDSLEQWTCQPGDNYDNVIEAYNSLLQQYRRHIGHVMPYIGGIVYKEVRQGHDDGYAQSYISKAKTQEAMKWLVDQIRHSAWLDKPSLVDKLPEANPWREKMERNLVACLFNSRSFKGISDGYQRDPSTGYRLYDYVNDAFQEIFRPAIQNKSLTDTDKHLLRSASDIFMAASGLAKTTSSKTSLSAANDPICMEYYTYLHQISESDAFCSHCLTEKGDDTFYRIVINLPTLPNEQYQPIMTSCLRKALQLYKSLAQKAPDAPTRDFYLFEVERINRFFNN